ncbi:MAG: chorismate mutase [Alphaproteobacteria bacterium]|nr:chorismate mutase [Alphaproteobacteria bacterium]
MNILTLRNNIDRLDNALLETLEQRFELVHEIGLQKDKSFYVGRPIREAEQLTRWMSDFPDLPLPTLLAIFRALVTTAITKEVTHFTVHSACQTETIASRYYGVADIACYQHAKQLFTAQHAADNNNNKHFISIIPLDDASYWHNETIGKNLFIIEALPIETIQKKAVILGYLPDEFIPHNHLFYCDDADSLPANLSRDIAVFADMGANTDNKIIYCYHSSENWQTAKQKLQNQSGKPLAITYLGGYSDSVQNALKNSNI